MRKYKGWYIVGRCLRQSPAEWYIYPKLPTNLTLLDIVNGTMADFTSKHPSLKEAKKKIENILDFPS